MESKILEKAKENFLKMIVDFGSDPYHLGKHVPEVERWAKYMLGKYPEADKEVVLLAVWLHDIGHYPLPYEGDHAARSEAVAKAFLEKEKYPEEKISRVLHCVRSHRCSDVMPKTLEAKIVAFCDSASHMTDDIYFDMSRDDKKEGREFRAYAKLERDFRDLSSFPEVKKELVGLYEAWKKLLEEYEKLNIKS